MAKSASVGSLLGLPQLREAREKLKAVRLEIVEGPSAMRAEGKIEVAVLYDDTMASGLSMRPVLTAPSPRTRSAT
jgi:hypothetical protein